MVQSLNDLAERLRKHARSRRQQAEWIRTQWIENLQAGDEDLRAAEDMESAASLLEGFPQAYADLLNEFVEGWNLAWDPAPAPEAALADLQVRLNDFRLRRRRDF